MTNQTTDEATVDILDRLRQTNPFVNDPTTLKPRLINPAGPDAADEIQSLRAQLTAATRRAEILAELSRDTAQAADLRAAKLEQAERMLAEVDAVFNENINKQADRLGVSPDKVESPGQWMMRVRRAAIRALKEQQP